MEAPRQGLAGEPSPVEEPRERLPGSGGGAPTSAPSPSPPGRLAREIEHHRDIADRSEIIWTWDTPSGQRRADRRAALFVEYAQLRTGRRALDLGCGTGIFLSRVAPSGARLSGLDLSRDLLRKAEARVRNLAKVDLTCGNAEHMPYPDGCFDAVYGSSILHHLDLDHALREVRRVLKPGGSVVFAEPNILNPQVALMFHLGLTKRYFGVSPDEMGFSRFRATRAMKTAGLESAAVRPFDFLHPSTPARWIEDVSRLGRLLEKVPLINQFAGSLLIVAKRPVVPSRSA